MNVFVTGGTGFVGREVVTQLIAAGHRVRCLVRRGSERKLAVRERVEVYYGDVTDSDSLVEAFVGWYFGMSYGIIALFVLLLATLVFRPQGLMGTGE